MDKAALFWSGGKDASLALYKIQQEGKYQVNVLVTTMNRTHRRIAMHGVREEMLDLQAHSIGIPLMKMWMPDVSTNAAYETVLLDTYDALIEQGINTIIFGDIFLEDLRLYREQFAGQKGLKLIFPLWQQPSSELLQQGWDAGFKTVTCCISTAFMPKTLLGKVLDESFVKALPPEVDPCGENGEFHTFCFDGPIFSQPIAYKTGEEKFSSLNDQAPENGCWFIDIMPIPKILPMQLTQDQIYKLAEKIWDYHHMHHILQKSDCILALGSHDMRVADRAAELYLQGWAPLIIFSGNLGNLTKGMWEEAEADKFARRAIELGVPENVILIENRSTNTGENILFTQQLLKEQQKDPHHFILVQKPYMERRSYATFKKQWPDKALIVTSPQIAFGDYPTEEISLERVINVMTGDLQRIKIYPAKGFQIYQEIPQDVWEAYEQLVAAGFTKHLAKE